MPRAGGTGLPLVGDPTDCDVAPKDRPLRTGGSRGKGAGPRTNRKVRTKEETLRIVGTNLESKTEIEAMCGSSGRASGTSRGPERRAQVLRGCPYCWAALRSRKAPVLGPAWEDPTGHGSGGRPTRET